MNAVRWLMLLLSGLTTSRAATDATVYTFDATELRRADVSRPEEARRVWDTMHLLSALQGLANRDAPRLYLFHCAEFGVETDRFWFDWLRGDGGWLKGATVRELPSLESVLEAFTNVYRGLVIYDGDVPATACLASTAAGVEGLLPVRLDPAPNSVFRRLTQDLKIPARAALVQPDGSSRFSGSTPKNAAYRWALDRWLASGACGPGVAAHYIDAWWLREPGRAAPDMHTLANHDWFIARKAFFFDLSPWGDEAPVDEPGQVPGADRATLLEVLKELHRNARGGLVKVGGFTPWPFKYTTHGGAGKHQPVPTEWEYARLLSQFNAYMEADAAGLGSMANASFYAHYPLRARYAQPNPKPGVGRWRERGFVEADGRVAKRFFVGHYVGDYDAPSWLYKAVPAFFRDPTRGQVPLGWAFNPNLADRAPQALAYAYANATTNDYFIAGNSGAGYLNPRALTMRPDSRVTSGLRVWQVHCDRYLARWGMTITGFLLDGAAGPSTATEFLAYASFSPDGMGTHFEREPALRAGVPTCPERDLPDDAAAAADFIAARAREAAGGTGFLWARSILKPPRWYAEVSTRLRERHGDLPIEVVDPYTFFGLIRRHLDASGRR